MVRFLFFSIQSEGEIYLLSEYYPLLRTRVDAELFQAVPEGFITHAEQAGRLCGDIIGFHHRFLEELALHLFEIDPLVRNLHIEQPFFERHSQFVLHIAGGWCRYRSSAQRARLPLRVGEYCLANGIPECLERTVADALDAPAEFNVVLVDKEINQCRNVFFPVTQRRKFDLDHPEPIVEIFAEAASGTSFSRFLLVAAIMRTSILMLSLPPMRPDLPILQYPENLGLHHQRKITDFIQKRVPLLDDSKRPVLRVVAPVKAPARIRRVRFRSGFREWPRS